MRAIGCVPELERGSETQPIEPLGIGVLEEIAAKRLNDWRKAFGTLPLWGQPAQVVTTMGTRVVFGNNGRSCLGHESRSLSHRNR